MIIFRKYWKDNQSHEVVAVGKTEFYACYLELPKERQDTKSNKPKGGTGYWNISYHSKLNYLAFLVKTFHQELYS